MTKYEIVAQIAHERWAEQMICNTARRELRPELQDLAQEVYLILLTYDADKIVDLWEHNQLRYFIARIIVNQYRSSLSPFHLTYRKFLESSSDITGMDFVDESTR